MVDPKPPWQRYEARQVPEVLSSYLENHEVADEAVALQQPSMDVEESPTVKVKVQSGCTLKIRQ